MFQLRLDRKKLEHQKNAIVELYCTAACVYCNLARKYFSEKGIVYHEFRVDLDKAVLLEMEYRSQKATVPQIFVNGYLVGGYEDLIAMDQSGQLEELL